MVGVAVGVGVGVGDSLGGGVNSGVSVGEKKGVGVSRPGKDWKGVGVAGPGVGVGWTKTGSDETGVELAPAMSVGPGFPTKLNSKAPMIRPAMASASAAMIGSRPPPPATLRRRG